MAGLYTYMVKGDMDWGQISYAVYGDATLFAGIIDANPDIPIGLIVPNGYAIQVPILDTIDVPVGNELLPPWKQTTS